MLDEIRKAHEEDEQCINARCGELIDPEIAHRHKATLLSLIDRARPYMEDCKQLYVERLREMNFAANAVKYDALLSEIKKLERLLEDMK